MTLVNLCVRLADMEHFHAASLTRVADVLRPVEGVLCGVLPKRGVDVHQGVVVVEEHVLVLAGYVAAVGAVDERIPHTLLPQVAHEELQADEGEDAETEHGEDHHVRQLLHRLDQGAHDGLQAWRWDRARGRDGDIAE